MRILRGVPFPTEHANYDFSKPLYVAVILVELIRRYNQYVINEAIEHDKRQQLVVAVLG
ncbi:MAG: hypothetical protein GY896_04895 [Gammaproteobacteria bacterium]|nr:hypothetical protein [Gammaproteobacteria bacterium]